MLAAEMIDEARYSALPLRHRPRHLRTSDRLRGPSTNLQIDVDSFDRTSGWRRSPLKTRKLERQRFGILLALPPWCEESNDVVEMAALDLRNDGTASDGAKHCRARAAARKH